MKILMKISCPSLEPTTAAPHIVFHMAFDNELTIVIIVYSLKTYLETFSQCKATVNSIHDEII